MAGERRDQRRDGRRDQRRIERRKASGDFRTRPRESPATMLVLVVSGVLLVTAAATMLFGGGFDRATPHGRLLAALESVADAQEVYYRETGEFASWRHSLDVDLPSDVELKRIRGGERQWEALVEAPAVGLICSQSGGWLGDVPLRERPVCYREDG